jgi:hypothetical protein
LASNLYRRTSSVLYTLSGTFPDVTLRILSRLNLSFIRYEKKVDFHTNSLTVPYKIWTLRFSIPGRWNISLSAILYIIRAVSSIFLRDPAQEETWQAQKILLVYTLQSLFKIQGQERSYLLWFQPTSKSIKYISPSLAWWDYLSNDTGHYIRVYLYLYILSRWFLFRWPQSVLMYSMDNLNNKTMIYRPRFEY